MKDDPPVGDDVLLARAGWPATFDRILAGLCHDLNGRAAALRGFIQLKAFGDAPASLDGLLEEEVERLEELARTLSCVPDRAGGEPELLAPRELLADLLRLHGKHRGLETFRTDLEVDREAPPLRAFRRRLQRALLVALGEAAWSAHRRGGRSLGISCAGGVDGGLLIEITPGPPSPARPATATEAAGVPGAGAGEAIGPLRELLARDGATLESVDRGQGLHLRLAFPPL